MSRLVNWFVGRLASVGFAPSDTIALHTIGRRSGKPRSTAVTWAENAGTRYLVSLSGESDWLRNVRAAKGRAEIGRLGRRDVRLIDVPVNERAPILHAYMSKRAFSRSPSYIARNYFDISPDASVDDLRSIAPRFPVLRIEEH